MSEMRQYVESFIRNRDLSLAKLADQLSYKSKTSIERIMDDNTRESSVIRFEQSMNQFFDLTEEEKSDLHRAIQITLHGKPNYLAQCEMWNFIQGNNLSSSRDVQIVEAMTGRSSPLLQLYSGMSQLHITLLNCPYVSLYTSLQKLLSQDDTTVDHYIYVNTDNARTIYAMNILMPIFYLRGYKGYSYTQNDVSAPQLPKGLMEADVMVCSYTDNCGEAHEDLIVFHEPDVGTRITSHETCEIFRHLLNLNQAQYSPIKRTYFECSAWDDYVRYSRDYAALERNRTIWKIKPDIGVDWIPTPILAAALSEGPIPHDENFNAVYSELYEIYSRRVQNSFSKRKHAYTVLKKGAMQKFMLTGKTTDHFWAMRPYTWEERIAILSLLLEQQRSNPYFHLFFLKTDHLIRDAEIACFEDVGILILEANTDYNLEKGHSEVMLSHGEMMHLFKDFFMTELIRKHTYPENESQSILQQLIEECKIHAPIDY